MSLEVVNAIVLGCPMIRRPLVLVEQIIQQISHMAKMDTDRLVNVIHTKITTRPWNTDYGADRAFAGCFPGQPKRDPNRSCAHPLPWIHSTDYVNPTDNALSA